MVVAIVGQGKFSIPHRPSTTVITRNLHHNERGGKKGEGTRNHHRLRRIHPLPIDIIEVAWRRAHHFRLLGRDVIECGKAKLFTVCGYSSATDGRKRRTRKIERRRRVGFCYQGGRWANYSNWQWDGTKGNRHWIGIWSTVIHKYYPLEWGRGGGMRRKSSQVELDPLSDCDVPILIIATEYLQHGI